MRKVTLLILVFAFLSITGCSNSAIGTAAKLTPTSENTISGDSNTETASSEPTPSVSFSSPTIPSVAAPSSATHSPTDNKSGNTNNQSSSDGADSALEAYKAVLENNSEFYSTENKKNVLFDDFLTNGEVFGTIFKPEHFTILDMDGDKVPEVVIELQAGNFFEVLHYYKGEVEGYIYSNRQLGQLKADGTFAWSGAASYWGYGKLNFKSTSDYKTDDIGYLVGENNNGVSATTYYIDNKPVTENAFNSFAEKQEAKPDAAWYGFSQKNIDAEFQKS